MENSLDSAPVFAFRDGKYRAHIGIITDDGPLDAELWISAATLEEMMKIIDRLKKAGLK